MKMKKTRGVITLILAAALLVLLAISGIKGFGPTGTGSAKNIILGLDLAGGVSITYETAEANPSAEDMSDTIYKLQKRVEGYSTEATVYREGDNRINIEIPGVSDANRILEDLGKPGSLYFITQTDNSGAETFSYDGSGYVLNFTQEELEANGALVLNGTDIADAQAGTQADELGNAQDVVKLEMTPDGATKFADATSANINKQIAIVYDGEIISAPVVRSAITDGNAVIEGMENSEEAEHLASSIRIGGLALELNELSSNVVGAQLGVTAISTSVKAGAIGLALVVILMCIIYLLPGLASSIALLIYVGLTVLLINAFNLTLTLPGIAGVVLAIGMAVDANVIIFARVREEISVGKPVSIALQTGFQKALSAILDGNITTLIAAIVLGFKGSGPVKGFAQTLALGIVVSMFTALVITRQVIFAFYAVGLKDEKYYGKAKERKLLHIVEKKKLWFAISGAVIAIGIVVMIINGSGGKGAFNYSLEFKGGTSTNVIFNEEMSLEEIDSTVVPVIEDATGETPQIQKVAGTSEVVFKTNTLTLEQREALNQSLVDKFGVNQETITSTNISGTISKEMRSDAVTAVIIAVILMLIYIWFRFKDIRFATSAVAALIHDVLVVLAVYAVARISVGNTFIACMLTIVGYSINATIVIFDRIREKLRTSSKSTDLALLVDESITQTMTRSIYTSLTTFIMVAVLYIMGVTSIREFALPLMAGIIAGGFSSVCITGTLWYLMRKIKGKKQK